MSQKKAILLVSFGTSYLESKAKTIDRIFTDVTEHFPDHDIYEAWTSKMILNILRKRDNLSSPSVEEAMETIVADGVQKLTVQPTHLINGLENDIMIHTILERAMDFIEVTFCDPLLTTTEDHRKVLNCLMAEYQSLSHEEALVLMGHGTAHHANSVYAALDYMLKDLDYPNIFLGTVEAYPSFQTLLRQIQKTSVKRIHLLPFMLTAGDHANKDMAGNQKDSWKSQFEAAGYPVICHIKGLGEYEGIRNIYLEHLQKGLLH